MKKLRARSLWPHFGRRKVLIGLVLALILLLSGGIVASIKAWHDYEADYRARYAVIVSDVDELMTNDSSIDATARLIALSEGNAATMKSAGSLCGINPLVEWQKLIGVYARKLDECRQLEERLNQYSDALDALVQYQKSEQALASIIKQGNLSTDQNNQEDKWQNIEAFWLQAISETNKMPNTFGQFDQIRQLFVGKMEIIAKSWAELSAANVAQDSQRFSVAQQGISTAYSELLTSSEQSSRAVESVVSSLADAYTNL